MSTTLIVTSVLIRVVMAVSSPASSQPGAPIEVTALHAGPRQMAEAAIAIDPKDPRHFAVAADPYLNPVIIQVAITHDGGRTWTPPIDITPPGSSKAYDPTLVFANNGDLLVAGGASVVGLEGCQTRSTVFLALLNGTTPRYVTVQSPKVDTYVDRPQLGIDRARSRAFVTWTESHGDGAECRGMPQSSEIKLVSATLNDEVPVFGPAVSVPSSGLSAPFGSSAPLERNGAVSMVVGERDGNGRGRAVLITTHSRGQTFEAPATLWSGTASQRSVAGIAGIVASVPSYAISERGKAAMAWDQTIHGSTAIVMMTTDAHDAWRPVTVVAPPPGTVETFAQVLFDQTQKLWLLTARFRHGNVDFVTRTFAGGTWTAPATIASGPSSHYAEIGEQLGFASAADRILTAVPIDGTRSSTLRVFTTLLPPSPPDTATTSTIAAAPPTIDTQTTSRPNTPTSTRHRGSDPGSLHRSISITLLIAFGVAFTIGVRTIQRHKLGKRKRRRSP